MLCKLQFMVRMIELFYHDDDIFQSLKNTLKKGRTTRLKKHPVERSCSIPLDVVLGFYSRNKYSSHLNHILFWSIKTIYNIVNDVLTKAAEDGDVGQSSVIQGQVII